MQVEVAERRRIRLQPKRLAMPRKHRGILIEQRLKGEHEDMRRRWVAVDQGTEAVGPHVDPELSEARGDREPSFRRRVRHLQPGEGGVEDHTSSPSQARQKGAKPEGILPIGILESHVRHVLARV